MDKNIKNKILATAYELFLKEGYRAATIREIAAKCGVSHTLVMYNFGSKANIAGRICKRYFRELLKTVDETRFSEEDTAYFCKMSWWTLHFLIITTHRDFGRFYMEFITDETDAFNEEISSFYPVVIGEMFGLRKNLTRSDFEADMFIVTNIDLALSRLCYEKKLKVNKAVSKFLNMNITPGLQMDITETEVEAFIEKYSLLKIAQEIDIKALL